jgi:hypothetical protein
MEVALEVPQEEAAVVAARITAVAQPMAAAAATQDQRAALPTNFQQVAVCSTRLRRTSSGKDGGLLYKLSTAGGRSGGQSPAGGGGIDDRDSRRGVLESNIADSCRSCYCEGPDLRAPTSEEFTGKYNDSVTDHLVKSGVLQNLQAIGGDVSEVVAIILAGDLTAFDSNVFVEVVGDAEFVTLQEISLAPPKHCSMIHNDLTWFYSGWLNLSLRKELKELP